MRYKGVFANLLIGIKFLSSFGALEVDKFYFFFRFLSVHKEYYLLFIYYLSTIVCTSLLNQSALKSYLATIQISLLVETFSVQVLHSIRTVQSPSKSFKEMQLCRMFPSPSASSFEISLEDDSKEIP